MYELLGRPQEDGERKRTAEAEGSAIDNGQLYDIMLP
jgi:hypothetical protein